MRSRAQSTPLTIQQYDARWIGLEGEFLSPGFNRQEGHTRRRGSQMKGPRCTTSDIWGRSLQTPSNIEASAGDGPSALFSECSILYQICEGADLLSCTSLCLLLLLYRLYYVGFDCARPASVPQHTVRILEVACTHPVLPNYCSCGDVSIV